jgi:diacylglycerol O-acyltransferase
MSKAIKKLSAMDACFLYLETPEMPMHVGSMWIFRLPEDYEGDFYEQFKKMIAGRLHLAPILKWKLVNAPLDIDHPSWIEDEDFDINRHVLRGAVPAPRDRATVETLTGWMHAKLLNRARPLWEFYVFDGLPNNEVVLYNRVHHACIDGGAGAAMTQIIFDPTPTPREVPPPGPGAGVARGSARDLASELMNAYLQLWPQPLRPSPKPGVKVASGAGTDLASMLTDSYPQLWQQPLKVLGGVPDILKSVMSGMGKLADPRTLLDLSKLVAPATPLNGAISSERSFAGVTLSLPRAKAVAAKAGGKLNDVVMAVSSGMLRRYLAEKGALPTRSLTAAVPISLREEGNAETNNQVSAMICSLASDIEDPKARLGNIIAESAKSKDLSNVYKPLMPYITDVSVLGAPMIMQLLAVLYSRSKLPDVLPPVANVAISNVPGPRKSLYGAGAELQHMYPVSLVAHGLALNITVLSYRDQLDFGLIAAANVVPNVRRLADMMPEELEKLEKAFGIAS